MASNLRVWWRFLLKPLMNERGAVGEGDENGEGGDKGNKPPEFYMGNWKTKEEAEKGFGELKGSHDKQGNEIGSLRKQVTELTDTLTKLMQTQGQTQTKDTGNTAETELGKIFDDLGTVDLVEEGASKKVSNLFMKAIRLTQQITKDETLKAAGNQFKETLSQRDAESLRNDWLKNNPQFLELKKSGKLEEIISKNALHDPFSAYHEAQVQDLVKKVNDLTGKLEEAEKVAKLAGGDSRTGKIFTKPGGVRPTGTKPKTPQERLDSAMQAVVNAEAKGGQ